MPYQAFDPLRRAFISTIGERALVLWQKVQLTPSAFAHVHHQRVGVFGLLDRLAIARPGRAVVGVHADLAGVLVEERRERVVGQRAYRRRPRDGESPSRPAAPGSLNQT